MALTYRNDVGCMWLNAITKQSLRMDICVVGNGPLKVRYKTHSLFMLRMRLSHIFERLLLKEILKMGKSRTGRPAKLGDKEALKCVFKVLRTGMQWREVDASVSFVTVFRRFQTWSKNNVFQNAYKRTIEVYRKLIPSKYYFRFFLCQMGNNVSERITLTEEGKP